MNEWKEKKLYRTLPTNIVIDTQRTRHYIVLVWLSEKCTKILKLERENGRDSGSCEENNNNKSSILNIWTQHKLQVKMLMKTYWKKVTEWKKSWYNANWKWISRNVKKSNKNNVKVSGGQKKKESMLFD